MDQARFVQYMSRQSPAVQQRFRNATRQQQQEYIQDVLASLYSPTSSAGSSPSSFSESPPPTTTKCPVVYQTNIQSQIYKQGFPCCWPECGGRVFTRAADLERHTDAMHNPTRQRHDCPISNCNRVGDNGLTRLDKLYDHVREKHKIDLPKQQRGMSRQNSR